jgi:hypothetical protein
VLYIVLVLVLAALGLLVAALITANSLWAWVSIGVSILAGVILVVDWLRRRSKRSAGATSSKQPSEDVDKVVAELPEQDETPVEAVAQTELLPAIGELDASVTAIVVPVADEDGEDADSEEAETTPARLNEDGDPGEEQTDAADLLIVSELDDEVVVVDEFPRYHVTECDWLVDRDTIPIGISEARQLGFTPCVRCGPDAQLAREHRHKRNSRADN